ncbi:MAG: NAD(P)H-hydrate epimerase [Phycisphaeraceae bacterium]|nr:NAD(P)H-hydrate epimerase [Phycisphaeraceae bacterium]
MRRLVKAKPSVYVLSLKAAREIDRACADRFGISTLVLMENAAVHIAEATLLLAPRNSIPRVLLVAGTGNNGGDAMAAARHLANAGASVFIVLVGDRAGLSSEAAAQWKTCKRMRLAMTSAKSRWPAAFRSALHRLGRRAPDVVIDGLFGTGLSRQVTGVALDAIRAMNSLAARGSRILSIDIASGLDGATGRVLGEAVHADMTVTFVGLKQGMLAPDAIEHLGRVVIADIGVPRTLVEAVGVRITNAD